MKYWGARKRKVEEIEVPEIDNSAPFPFPFSLPDLSSNASVHSENNNIYFNDDITESSCFALKKELRQVDKKYKDLESVPIYLHLTTNGGDIHSALSVVDCINALTCSVYTVIDGFVASAGTLLSLAGEKRYIRQNAYALIHQLRSGGYWGKLEEIKDTYFNLNQIAKHITDYYLDKTKMTKKKLLELLKKDIILNTEECIKLGLVDEIYTK